MRLAPATLLLFACASCCAGAGAADALTKDVDAPVAVVNGETISESELMRGVPKGIFGRSRQWAREARPGHVHRPHDPAPVPRLHP